MSIWISTKDQMPPINEEVLILYKDKKDELKEENPILGLRNGHILSSIRGITRWYIGHHL